MTHQEVTFKDFATVARKRGHTVESLADRFRGKIENPSEFFERVMTYEPLRKVEQEWLDRIFARERCSRAWIGLATVMATAEEQGIHIENHLQVPANVSTR